MYRTDPIRWAYTDGRLTFPRTALTVSWRPARTTTIETVVPGVPSILDPTVVAWSVGVAPIAVSAAPSTETRRSPRRNPALAAGVPTATPVMSTSVGCCPDGQITPP